MGIVISLLNSKGGTGKSTITTNLARSLQLDGFNVVIGDADPQGTARQWSSIADEDADMVPVFGLGYDTIEREVGKIKQAFDFIVIDGAAKMEARAMAPIIKISDLILIPVQPSSADIWAAKDLVDAILARQEVTDGKPKALFVVSRQIIGTTLAGEVGEALETQGLKVLNGRTSQRVVYTDAIGDGVSVYELDREGKACKEVTDIKTGVLEVLKNG